ncbi:hypothetical protein LCGC14_2829740 [marine sediment metagenome]|uniref:Uncharacterized protein n=1 Tax=marine sediment metagenome TaxID=412755 RepID=A0A0F8YEF0_9ZZZZ
MGRPKGSKSKNRDGYTKRTEDIRKRYGEDAYKRWGKLGGNPILLKKDK